MTTYPENSLLALQAAAELGFSYVELDIQLSKDSKPIVIHDETLLRTTGINRDVKDITVDELNAQPLLCSTQAQDKKNLLYISTLGQAVEILNDFPEITLFVELKRQSIKHFGIEDVVEVTLDAVRPAKFNVVLISFVDGVVEYIKQKDIYPVGWALKRYDQGHFEKANKMLPEYLFCNVKKINKPLELWQGPWAWTLYDIKNPAFAYELLKQGVSLIETGDIVKLINSEEFD